MFYIGKHFNDLTSPQLSCKRTSSHRGLYWLT